VSADADFLEIFRDEANERLEDLVADLDSILSDGARLAQSA
jgi:hypothetical protein